MKQATDFLPLTAPVFHILLALADDERHGYAILQEVEARSRGSVRLGTGTLYTAIKRMLDWGLIEKAESRLDPALEDERRRYYRITPLGQQALKTMHTRWEKIWADQPKTYWGVRPPHPKAPKGGWTAKNLKGVPEKIKEDTAPVDEAEQQRHVFFAEQRIAARLRNG